MISLALDRKKGAKSPELLELSPDFEKKSLIYDLNLSKYAEIHGDQESAAKSKPNMIKKSIYIGFSVFFFTLS